MMVSFLFAGLTVLALLAGRAVVAQDWRSASSAPAGLAPDPETYAEAVVQVYGARTWGWKGTFGVHTWVAVKPKDAKAYTVYEVIGWRRRWSESVVSVRERPADARWYGNLPEVYADKRGELAEKLIPRIEAAVLNYPYAGEYTLWPGPNSNTFTAWITRSVPELDADLPPTAIGKDYIPGGIFGSAPSGHGLQFSLGGLFAITASGIEGLELNLLGLTVGVNPFDPAIRLPLFGRLGPARALP